MSDLSNPTIKRYTLKWLVITVTCIVLLKQIIFLLGEPYAFLNPFNLTSYNDTIYKLTFFIGVVAIAVCLGVYDYKNALTKYHTEPLAVEEIYAMFEELANEYERGFLEKFGKKRLGLTDYTFLNAQGSQQLRLIMKAHNEAQSRQDDAPLAHPMFISKLQDIVNTRS